MLVRIRLERTKHALIVPLALLALAGCSRQSTRALNKSLADAGLTRETVYPLAGKLTVDGSPPEIGDRERIIAMLCDPAQLDSPPAGRRVTVDPHGNFAFGTYEADDGVRPGTYILIFAKFKVEKNKGLVGPDGFLNLYNDPARNEKEHPELKIDHKARGKKDYAFDLQIAGHERVDPGPATLTHIVIRGQR
jgi:hypothetical protein